MDSKYFQTGAYSHKTEAEMPRREIIAGLFESLSHNILKSLQTVFQRDSAVQ